VIIVTSFIGLNIFIENRDLVPKKYKSDTQFAFIQDNLKYIPLNFLVDATFQFKKRKTNKKIHDISKVYPFALEKEESDLLVVLVIGESSRFDKYHINGYSKPTSPNLDAIKNLISLKNYFALETLTTKTMPYIYKRSNNSQFIDPLESGFVSVFKALGFKTFYLSTQIDVVSEIYRFVREYDYTSIGARNRIFSVANRFYDEGLLSETERITSKKGKRLLVLHTMGSHYNYADRVPEVYKSKYLDDYENTIKYSDHILGKILNEASKVRSIVFYTSDHGESLEGDKTRMHGYPIHLAMQDAPEQIHIPGFWFFSKQYLEDKTNEHKFENIKKHANLYIDQSFIFHSLLGCSGVISSTIQSEKNLCADLLPNGENIN